MIFSEADLQRLWLTFIQDQAKARVRESVRSRPAPPPSSNPTLIKHLLEQAEKKGDEPC